MYKRGNGGDYDKDDDDDDDDEDDDDDDKMINQYIIQIHEEAFGKLIKVKT